MRYLVDTDWVVDYLSGQKAADELFTALLPEGIAISIITFSEIYEGIYGSRNPQRAEAAFRAFLREVAVLGINRAVAKRNGQIRRELRRQHRQIAHRAFDLLIAATTLEHSLTLVTRNLDDYADIPGLDIYESGRHTPEKRPS